MTTPTAFPEITEHDLFCLGEVLANFNAWVETDAGEFLAPQMREYGRVTAALAEKLAALATTPAPEPRP